MAKDAAELPPSLQGVRVALDWGSMAYAPTHILKRIAALGGEVVPEKADGVSLIVVRGGDAPAKEDPRLTGRPGEPQTVDAATFCRWFAPTAEELGAALRGAGTALGDLLDKPWGVPGFELPSLEGIDLGELQSRGHGNLRLEGADLRRARFTDGRVEAFVGCDLRGTSLAQGSFQRIERCDLRQADLRLACLHEVAGSDLRGANLDGIRQIQASDSDLGGASLVRAVLDGAKFERCSLEEAKLSGSDLSRASLAGARLAGADLSGALLMRADLSGADLSGADLSGANLGGARLAGARLAGARFEGANLSGAEIPEADRAGAVGLAEALARVRGEVGPKVRELDTVAKAAERIRTGATFERADGTAIGVEIDLRSGRSVQLVSKSANDYTHKFLPTVLEAMQDAAWRWHGCALRLESIAASGSKSPVSGKALRQLVVEAWCELCGIEAPAPAAPKKGKASGKAQREQQLAEEMLADLRGGPEGIARFHARDPSAGAPSLARSGLTGCTLDGVRLTGLDLSVSNLDGASLRGAEITGCKLDRASLVGVDLTGAVLRDTTMVGVDLTGATLHDLTLERCDLGGETKLSKTSWQRVRLPGSKLVSTRLDGVRMAELTLEGADLAGARLGQLEISGTFDGYTRFPPGYKPPAGLVGPRDPKGMPVPASDLKIDLDAFLTRLKATVGASGLAKATQMLRGSRFQLFHEVDDQGMMAIVRSASDPGRIYACILREGSYSCGTNRLNRCASLGRGPCKHMLVMIVGLARAGEVDPQKVDAWVQASMKTSGSFDRDTTAGAFVRYKAAEAGELDWRPTETLPEDYYAL